MVRGAQRQMEREMETEKRQYLLSARLDLDVSEREQL
jgi:hypothetical protein